jgi:hypothetical protein
MSSHYFVFEQFLGEGCPGVSRLIGVEAPVLFSGKFLLDDEAFLNFSPPQKLKRE